MFDERLVVRYLDGTSAQGYGDPFMPGEAELLLQDETGEIHRVDLAAVKLICFVKSFVTDSQITHVPAPPLLYRAVPGRRIQVDFTDGERMEGAASLTSEPKAGFFLTPLNPESNNLQVYVNLKSVRRFRFLD